MSIHLTPEERATGQGNAERVAGGLSKADGVTKPEEMTRRRFMTSLAFNGAVVAAVAPAVYFGYRAGGLDGGPVKAALIGGGDEGGVLVGEHSPEYLEFVAVCDIRPTNLDVDPKSAGGRIFTGEKQKVLDKNGKEVEVPRAPRLGLQVKYDKSWQRIRRYRDYKALLADKDKLGLEAVVIALPLHLHAPVAIDCMRAGLHVLCEKLMAWNITQCKEMIREARANDVVLSIGHQRHYSMLYAHAQDLMRSGVLGHVRHIRAQWHRNNARPNPNAKKDKEESEYIDSWRKKVPAADRKALEELIRHEMSKPAGQRRYDLLYKNPEEACRWRLFNRTGGGLMAELGSHQLDACSIFLGKVKPLAVTAVGGNYFYRDEREVEDHVFCTFEFPGPGYWKDGEFGAVGDRDSRVVVTYSSISTNSFEPYGECVLGSTGTMVVEQEQGIALFGVSGRATEVGVTVTKGGPVLGSGGSDPGAVKAGGAAGNPAPTSGWGTISRGYREEMEHFAYCVRQWKQGANRTDRPRCHGEVAMADAIIALTTNLAMERQQRIEFKKEWFDPASAEVPDPDKKPEVVTA